jgi:hypothetical protein
MKSIGRGADEKPKLLIYKKSRLRAELSSGGQKHEVSTPCPTYDLTTDISNDIYKA